MLRLAAIPCETLLRFTITALSGFGVLCGGPLCGDIVCALQNITGFQMFVLRKVGAVQCYGKVTPLLMWALEPPEGPWSFAT